MDTNNWKSCCVGRYLIDIPLYAGVVMRETSIRDSKIQWRPDLTPQSARQEAETLMLKFKNTPHEKFDSPQFIDALELANGGIAVHAWEEAYLTTSSIFHCFMVSRENRVFHCKVEVTSDLFANGRKFVTDLAANLHARDDSDPIPVLPGLCLAGGFNTHSGKWRPEVAVLGFELPAFPSLYFVLETTTRSYNSRPLWEYNFGSTDNFKVMCKGKFDSNGLQVQEYGLYSDSFANDGTYKRYIFWFDVASVAYRLDRPQVEFLMHNEDNNHYTGHIFDSPEQALGLWEALTRSIRLRPGAV
jgi:hypothetical protein